MAIDEIVQVTEQPGRTPTRRRPIRGHQPKRSTVLALQLAIVALLLGLWELAATQEWIDPFFWSQPTEVASEARRYFASGDVWTDSFFTVRSAVIGFIMGTTLGSTLGMSLWWSTLAARVVEPLIVAAHAVPKLAFAPLFVIIFGLGLQSKVAMVIALTLVTTALTAHAGVKAVDPDLITLLDSLGASKVQVFRKVVAPSALPWIASALRINIGLSLTGAIVGEMIGSRQGLGRMVFHAATVYNVGRIWTGAMLLAAIALTMYASVSWLERRVLRGLLHTQERPRG
jgi:NitT/TauT family transport system permease protein